MSQDFIEGVFVGVGLTVTLPLLWLFYKVQRVRRLLAKKTPAERERWRRLAVEQGQSRVKAWTAVDDE